MFEPYRPYRAPSHHGEVFSDPPWEQAAASLADNVQLRSGWDVAIGDASLTRLAAAARVELLQLARDYTEQYCDLPSRSRAAASAAPVILTGHQPRLFHAGVWFKNFLADRLAKQVHGTAVHLIVDNDLGGTATIRVPAGSVDHPHLETMAYDRAADEIPFEERGLLDRAQFEAFGERVQRLVAEFVPRTLLDEWWPGVCEVARRESNLGRCLAQARHQLERDWGSVTLEVPLGIACETDSFRRFVLHLLDELPRLLPIYNDSLFEYRRVNRIRSRAHPVPELERSDGWFEVPLWVWTQADPRRRRLFARRRAGVLELTDRSASEWTLRGRIEDALEDLTELARGRVRIRPRALVTTMYARLVLCDWFVHGIGGGKYDQLTDAIVRRWFGIEPPRFHVATATAQLPIARPRVSSEELLHVRRALRDRTFNPDRYLDASGPAAALIAEKRKWLATELPRGEGRPRHTALLRINAALQSFVAEQQKQLRSDRDRLDDSLRVDRLLGSREFAFCLFPESTLRPLLLDNA